MAHLPIALLLLLFNISVFALNITHSPKTVQLNKTGQTTLAVLSETQVIVGYDFGKLEIIDIQTRKTKKQFFHFQDSINSIVVVDQNKIFAHNDKRVVMLDNDGIFLRQWKAKQVILGISLALNETGFGYIAVVTKRIVQQYSFSNITHANRYYTFYETGEDGADLAAYSPKHTHLYLINGRNKKFVVFYIANTTIFDPSFLNRTKPPSSNSSEHNGSFKSNQSQQNKSKMNQNQRFQQEDMGAGPRDAPKDITRSRLRDVIVERRYNFRIKQILADQKQANTDHQALIMVAEQDVVYVTKKGAITAFLPYKNHTQDSLIAICFCQKQYLLLLHKHMVGKTSLFYLSYFNKRSLIAQKVLELNSIFYNMTEIKTMDCNFKLITLLTESKILVLVNQFSEQQEDVFDIEQQFKNLNQTNQLQWVLTAVIILLFICCCRRKKRVNNTQEQHRKEEDQEQQEEEEEVQAEGEEQADDKDAQKKVTQLNKPQNDMKQGSPEKKVSEKSTESESKFNKNESKSNKDKLLQKKDKSKQSKNKKKLN